MNHRPEQRVLPPSLPRLYGISKAQLQHVALAHQPSVQFHFVPGTKPGDGFQQALIEFPGVFFFEETDESRFVLDDAAQVHDVGRPVKIAIGKGQHDANVHAVICSHAFIVHRNEHSGFTSNALIDRAVIVRGSVFSMLKKFFFGVDFKRPRPVLLFDH